MRNALFCVLVSLGFSLLASAQGNDLAVVVGAKFTPNPTSAAGTTTINTAAGIEGSLAVQLLHLPFASLQFEFPVMVTPNATVTSSNFLASKNYNSLYITPGARFKFKPTARFNPWVAAGGGLVRFSPSPFSHTGGLSAATGSLKGAFDVGGGIDFKVKYIPVVLRAEAREYFSGTPNLNIPNLSFHSNLFAGLGLVARF